MLQTLEEVQKQRQRHILQNTSSALFADLRRAPLEQAPAPAPSKAFSKHHLCPVFFLVQLPLALTGTNLIGVWQFAVAVADSRHATLTCLSRGEQCSTNTPPPFPPSPSSIPSQNAFVLLHEDSYFFLLQSTESLAEQPAAPGTLGPAIKTIILHSGVQMISCSLYLYFKKE